MDYNARGLDMYLESTRTMFTGIGIGTFMERSTEWGGTDQIHNTFLWLLVEGGPALLLFLLVIIWRAHSRALAISRLRWLLCDTGTSCWCALMFCTVWFVAIEGMYQRQFWLMLALIEASYFQLRMAPIGQQEAIQHERSRCS